MTFSLVLLLVDFVYKINNLFDVLILTICNISIPVFVDILVSEDEVQSPGVDCIDKWSSPEVELFAFIFTWFSRWIYFWSYLVSREAGIEVLSVCSKVICKFCCRVSVPEVTTSISPLETDINIIIRSTNTKTTTLVTREKFLNLFSIYCFPVPCLSFWTPLVE